MTPTTPPDLAPAPVPVPTPAAPPPAVPLSPAEARVWDAFHRLSGPDRRLVTCAAVAADLGIGAHRVRFLVNQMERQGLELPRHHRRLWEHSRVGERKAAGTSLRKTTRAGHATRASGAAQASGDSGATGADGGPVAYQPWDAQVGAETGAVADGPHGPVRGYLAEWRRWMRKRYGRGWRRAARSTSESCPVDTTPSNLLTTNGASSQ
jgi:hypothetical protein